MVILPERIAYDRHGGWEEKAFETIDGEVVKLMQLVVYVCCVL